MNFFHSVTIIVTSRYNMGMESKELTLILELMKTNSKATENLGSKVDSLRDDISLLKIQVTQLQDHDLLQKTPAEIHREIQIKMRKGYFASGGFGAISLGGLMALWGWLKDHLF